MLSHSEDMYQSSRRIRQDVVLSEIILYDDTTPSSEGLHMLLGLRIHRHISAFCFCPLFCTIMTMIGIVHLLIAQITFPSNKEEFVTPFLVNTN